MPKPAPRLDVASRPPGYRLRRLRETLVELAPAMIAVMLAPAGFILDVGLGSGALFTLAYGPLPFAIRARVTPTVYWWALAISAALCLLAVPIRGDSMALEAWADRAVVVVALAAIYWLVDRLARARVELARATVIDATTDLMTREPFLRGCRREFLRARRYRTPLSLVLFELDRSDHVFARDGSRGVDSAMRLLATIIQRDLRPSDLVARYDDLQIIVAMPETTTEAAVRVANRQRQGIIAASGGKIGAPSVTMSGGIATYVHGDRALDEIIERAARALAAAGTAGGDAIRVEAGIDDAVAAIAP